MFHCYVHGWSHIERPCPLCNPLRTYSSGSTEILIPLPEKEKPVDMYQGLNDEDLRRLRRADVMYIAQLIEGNEKIKTELANCQGILSDLVNQKNPTTSPAWQHALDYIKKLNNVKQ